MKKHTGSTPDVSKLRSFSVAAVMLSACFIVIATALAATVTTDPNAFQTAIAGLGTPTTINFEDIDASPVNNSTAGRAPLNGSFYAGQGITFSNPNGVPLYIAPGGLFWNASNSLSVSNFPFEGGSDTDDDLVITFNPPVLAVGFTFVDNGGQRPDEFVQFLDADGAVIQQVGFPPGFAPFRAFLGIVSTDRPVARVNIVEAPNDGDDVAYDDFIFVPGANIDIDIKPGSFPNSINPRSNGVIPVAILTTNTFDATTVDPLSARFGPNGAMETHGRGHLEDADGDGDTDLVLHFRTQETGIQCGDTQAALTGSTFGGQFVTGADSVSTVGCRPAQLTVTDVGPELGVAFGPEGFVIRPNDPDQILVSTSRVGVSKSTDGGRTWFRANNGLTDALGIVALPLAVRSDRSNPATAFAPTNGDGLYRTTDFGDAWAPTGNLPNPFLSDCAVDPTSSGIVYALTAFVDEPGGLPGPLFKSADGGASFVEVGNGLPDLDATTNVAISPANPNLIYVMDIGTFEGVYKSTDGGLNFTRLAASPSQPLTLYSHPAQANTFLLVTLSGSTGLSRSTDGGATFAEVTTGLPAGQRANAVAYTTANPAVVYAGGPGGLFRSTDGGATFSGFGRLRTDQLGFFGVVAVGIDPTNSNVIYVNTSKGNFRTVNGGKSFVEINRGFRASQVNHLVFDNHSSPSLYACTFNTVGLLRTNNRGNNYEVLGEGLPNIQVTSVAVAATNRNHIVVATGDGIYRSTNGGRAWAQASVDTGQTFFGGQASRVAIDPGNPNNVYAVTSSAAFPGFYRSTDGGQSFTRSNAGLTQPNLGTVAIDPSNANVIYVGAWAGNAGAFKSTNGGLSFTPTGQTTGNIAEIVIDPAAPQVVYIGLRGGPTRVRRSPDGGATFATVDVGLSGNGVRGLVIDPLNPARLFVWLRTGGLFQSEDGGDSWSVLDPGGETLRRAKPARGAMAINPRRPNLLYLGSASILEVEIRP